MTDPTLWDCGLSKRGVEQSEFAASHADELEVGLVIVSPLVWALETAVILFKNHHNKPWLLVVPWCREHLHSTCDVPGNIS